MCANSSRDLPNLYTKTILINWQNIQITYSWKCLMRIVTIEIKVPIVRLGFFLFSNLYKSDSLVVFCDCRNMYIEKDCISRIIKPAEFGPWKQIILNIFNSNNGYQYNIKHPCKNDNSPNLYIYLISIIPRFLANKIYYLSFLYIRIYVVCVMILKCQTLRFIYSACIL